MLLRGSHDKVGHPGEVFLLEMNIAEGVIGMSVESGGDEDELGFELLDGRKPVAFYCLSKSGSFGAGFEGGIDDIRSFKVVVAMGVVGVLKAGSDEDCRGVLEDVDRSVSVMNIEVKDSHPFHFLMGQGSGCSHCDIVVKAEPHSGVVFSMVSRRSCTGEDASAFPGKDEIDCFFQGSGGQAGGGE